MQNLLTIQKPWGEFRQFTKNESTTVKVLLIRAHQSISLQEHFHRSEFWRVLAGTPTITIGEKVISAKEGDEFEIPQKTFHRIEAGSSDAQVLEISSGDFDENDIVRTEDNYGRA